MRKNTVLICFASLIGLLSTPRLFASEEPEAMPLGIRAPLTPLPPLPEGTTQQIAEDWHRRFHAETGAPAPDHSLRTIWVRMFPLLNVPGGDPYSHTQNIYRVQLQNAAGLNVYALDTHAPLGTVTTLALDFSKSSFKLGTATVAMQALWVVPADGSPTQLNWDTGYSTAIGIRLRGGFVVQGIGQSMPLKSPSPAYLSVRVGRG